MPIGTLMKKTLRHPDPAMSAVTRAPPSNGPITAAMPLTPPMIPKMGARSFGLNSACSVASACGTMSAENAPCTTREATSMSPLTANAPSADASVKPATPMRKVRWRPRMSPNRPPVTSSTANASMYPLTIHSSCEAVAPSSVRIDGSATCTIVTSSRSMNDAKMRMPIASPRRVDGVDMMPLL